MSLATGEIHVFHAKAVLLATGGCGRVYSITSNAHAVTGDGMAAALRAGIPLEDMEFYQFHPTGICKLGILLSEAARGEGGVLRNREGERFMERYAPTLQDLAPRDMVARAMYHEIREGRGIGGRNFLHLDLTHLGAEVIESKLPGHLRLRANLSGHRSGKGADPRAADGPLHDGRHSDRRAGPRGRRPQNTLLPGLYAAGECACVSVHGGNRLGTNSLVDILVFGRRGRAMPRSSLPIAPGRHCRRRPTKGHASGSNGSRGTAQERPGAVLRDLQETMIDEGGHLPHRRPTGRRPRRPGPTAGALPADSPGRPRLDV